MTDFRYRLFGLTLSSELALPELDRADAGQADVRILLVDHVPGGADCLAIDDVAAYRVPDRRTIEVRPAAGSDPAAVRLFLLGSVMAMLLYRRGDLPLHANAVIQGGAAWAFFGQSGAGKSTLAAWFQRRGAALLADDVCVIRAKPGGRPSAFAGPPRIRLWEDAVLREGYVPSVLNLTLPGEPEYRKFDVPIASAGRTESAPLQLLCLLESANQWSVESLIGLTAVEALFAHSYRGEHVGGLGDPEHHWRTCVELAQRIPIFRYNRTMRADVMDEENAAALDAMLAAIRGLPQKG